MRQLLLVIVLLAAGCSKQTKWDYETVEGDDDTPHVYGKYGWELVSARDEVDGAEKYVFRRDASIQQSPEEIDAMGKEDERRLKKLSEEIRATPTPEPQWQTDYNEKMQALDEQERAIDRKAREDDRINDANKKLIEACIDLWYSQIDARTDIDEAGKNAAKARAGDFASKLAAQSEGMPVDSGTLPNGNNF